MASINEQAKLQGRLYDSLITFNKAAEWPQLQLAQMRQHLAEHLANALPATNRADVLNEAIEAARSEYLHDDTGTPEDEAYNRGVSDAVAAIGALLEDGK
ncbi:hypothetical protein PV405_08620 [Streptomyces sp. ME02-6979-3A]|uniref:hypothetical protein n=1 Tax=Streptomyces sp. ME02-6979-3A TaxID=3028673 RepID=UPI0029A11485|nr:hypothetical protein [Streptomyces sp. ME02-6979-3A]MDX3324729.1 hypothetical protein [Streptomyces sp. ME02-6979-3A]